ncbi:Fc.00g032270.m01.CDS01 [Cosmosporella sp. VM-42]
MADKARSKNDVNAKPKATDGPFHLFEMEELALTCGNRLGGPEEKVFDTKTKKTKKGKKLRKAPSPKPKRNSGAETDGIDSVT